MSSSKNTIKNQILESDTETRFQNPENQEDEDQVEKDEDINFPLALPRQNLPCLLTYTPCLPFITACRERWYNEIRQANNKEEIPTRHHEILELIDSFGIIYSIFFNLLCQQIHRVVFPINKGVSANPFPMGESGFNKTYWEFRYMLTIIQDKYKPSLIHSNEVYADYLINCNLGKQNVRGPHIKSMINYINTEVYEETKSVDYSKNEKYLAKLSKDDCEKLYNYNIKYESVIWLQPTIHNIRATTTILQQKLPTDKISTVTHQFTHPILNKLHHGISELLTSTDKYVQDAISQFGN